MSFLPQHLIDKMGDCGGGGGAKKGRGNGGCGKSGGESGKGSGKGGRKAEGKSSGEKGEKEETQFESGFLDKNKLEQVTFLQHKKSYSVGDGLANLGMGSSGKREVQTIDLVETENGEFDIFLLDGMIRKKIKNNESKLPNHEEQLKVLTWIRDNTDDDIERKDAIERIFLLNKEIAKFSNYNQLNEYENSIRPIIEEYNKVLSKKVYSSFVELKGSQGSKSSSPNANAKQVEAKKQELQRDFFQIASKYVKINPLKTKKKTMSCANCSGHTFAIDDDDTVYCVKCNTCTNMLESSPAFKDKDRINMSKRFRYSCERHFLDAFDKVQGKQNTYIAPAIIDRIKEFMVQNENINKDTLEIEHIMLVLQMHGYNDKYEDVYLIHSMVTGKRPRDISKYKDAVLRDYKKQQEISGDIKITCVRKNSLNVYYVLCRLLQKNGYKCKLSEFYCLKTDETKDEHDDVWKRRCEKLGWDVLLD